MKLFNRNWVKTHSFFCLITSANLPFVGRRDKFHPSMNSTILNSTPINTTVLGDPDLICKPAPWWTVVKLFLVSYVSHCFTIRSLPGERRRSYFLAALMSLFFPTAGLLRALDGIACHSRLARDCKDGLQRAAQAGALTMVARSPEGRRPQVGDSIYTRLEYKKQEQPIRYVVYTHLRLSDLLS